ncbi:lipid A-modifier LpxR family protein [Halovulum sp. GXIMD14793]
MAHLKRILVAAYALLMSSQLTIAGTVIGEFVGDVAIHTNDAIGDGHDRYRSHASQKSYFFKNLHNGIETELRYRLEIISPASTRRNPSDRPYVGAIGIAAFAHLDSGRTHFRIGGELLAVGDQTGVARLQQATHEALGLARRGRTYLPEESNQPSLRNQILPMFQIEASRNLPIRNAVNLRPFVEGQLGYENKLTVGADLIVGQMAANRRWAREVVTGALQGTKQDIFRLQDPISTSLVAGFDIAFVSSSAFIPESSSLTLEAIRYRARLGLQTTLSDSFSMFVGQAWLSKEFTQQRNSQRLGIIAFDLRF